MLKQDKGPSEPGPRSHLPALLLLGSISPDKVVRLQLLPYFWKENNRSHSKEPGATSEEMVFILAVVCIADEAVLNSG